MDSFRRKWNRAWITTCKLTTPLAFLLGCSGSESDNDSTNSGGSTQTGGTSGAGGGSGGVGGQGGQARLQAREAFPLTTACCRRSQTSTSRALTKNRVYFDSSEAITASTFAGFTISGKNISTITVNTGQKSDHYFTTTSTSTTTTRSATQAEAT